MNIHQATFVYERPLPSGDVRLLLDLFPAIPSSYGALHDDFVSRFRLSETAEVDGLVSLRAQANLSEVLDFLGTSWERALDRWPELAAMTAYRQENGTDAYSCLESWITFYKLLDDQVLPDRIDLAVIEQP